MLFSIEVVSLLWMVGQNSLKAADILPVIAFIVAVAQPPAQIIQRPFFGTRWVNAVDVVHVAVVVVVNAVGSFVVAFAIQPGFARIGPYVAGRIAALTGPSRIVSIPRQSRGL